MHPISENAEYHADLGHLLSEQNDFEQARECYQRALEINPELPDLDFNLAVVSYQCGDLHAARYHYENAISLQPSDVVAKLNLAVVYEELQLPYRAVRLLYKLIRESPNDIEAYTCLGDLYLRLSRSSKAVSIFEKGLRANPTNFVLANQLTRIHLSNNRTAEASRIFEQLLHQNPSSVEAYRKLGDLQLAQGNYPRAAQCFNQAVKLDPKDLSSLDRCGFALACEGNWSSAFECFRELALRQRQHVSFYRSRAKMLKGINCLEKVQIECARFFGVVVNCVDDNANSEKLRNSLFRSLMSVAILLQKNGSLEAAMSYQNLAKSLAATPCSATQVHPLPSEAEQLLNDVHLPANDKTISSTSFGANRLRVYQKTLDWIDDSSQSTDVRCVELSSVAHPRDAIPSGQTPTRQCSRLNCAGVHCAYCWDHLIEKFDPKPLSNHVFRCSGEGLPYVEWERPFVVSIPNGYAWASTRTSTPSLACDMTAILTPDNCLLGDISRFYPWHLPASGGCDFSRHPISDRPNLPDPVELSGNVAWLPTLSGHVYYHWMVDVVPRLMLLQQSGFDLKEIDWFVINNLGSFQSETLMRLGIPIEKVIESDRVPQIRAENLIVPSFPSPMGWTSKTSVDCLREIWPTSSASKETNALKRIYVSRSLSRHRQIVNEPEVIEFLARYNFGVVHLEEMTIAQQADQFASAEVIVAPHGGGLTNTVFCRPGTRVIELFSPNYVTTYYWTISRLLQLDHLYILGNAMEGEFIRRLMYRSALMEDLEVDVNSLHQALASIELEL